MSIAFGNRRSLETLSHLGGVVELKANRDELEN